MMVSDLLDPSVVAAQLIHPAPSQTPLLRASSTGDALHLLRRSTATGPTQRTIACG